MLSAQQICTRLIVCRLSSLSGSRRNDMPAFLNEVERRHRSRNCAKGDRLRACTPTLPAPTHSPPAAAVPDPAHAAPLRAAAVCHSAHFLLFPAASCWGAGPVAIAYTHTLSLSLFLSRSLFLSFSVSLSLCLSLSHTHDSSTEQRESVRESCV